MPCRTAPPACPSTSERSMRQPPRVPLAHAACTASISNRPSCHIGNPRVYCAEVVKGLLHPQRSTPLGSQCGTCRVHSVVDVKSMRVPGAQQPASRECPSRCCAAGALLAESAAVHQDHESLPCAYMVPSCIAVRAGSLCSAECGLCWCMTPVGWVMPGWVAVVFMPDDISSGRSRPCICAGMCRGCLSEDTILPPGMSDILSC
jgi:hypothetical protein